MDMDSEVMKFYTSRPHGTKEFALKNFERYMTYMENNPRMGGFVAFHRETNEFVGLGVLIHLELNSVNDRYEVGYRLPVNQWGKGYATEIARRLLEYGFNDLGLHEIYGTTHPDHLVSQRVLLKLGLKNVGHSSNYGGSAVFKILKDEF